MTNDYRNAVEPYAASLRMIRDAIEELFGPYANLESEEATLLRGPEPHHEAEAIIASLQNVGRTMFDLIEGNATTAPDGSPAVDVEASGAMKVYPIPTALEEDDDNNGGFFK